MAQPNTRRTPRKKNVTCADCFFHCNTLCALNLDEPCPTFRPNGPDGLAPPRQLMLMPKEERPVAAPGLAPIAGGPWASVHAGVA